MPPRKKFNRCPIGYLHIDPAEVCSVEGKLYLFVAIDRTSKLVFTQLASKADVRAPAEFLQALIAAVPYRIRTVHAALVGGHHIRGPEPNHQSLNGREL
jgi:hypothetical protein